ncbi:MAG: hypothetical protein AB4426_03410 [Xenococcaceae cyanobacterium]
MSNKNFSKITAVTTTTTSLILTVATGILFSPPAEGFTLQTDSNGFVTSEQIRDLKSLGIKIAVPSYVPDRFRIDKVQAIK